MWMFLRRQNKNVSRHVGLHHGVDLHMHVRDRSVHQTLLQLEARWIHTLNTTTHPGLHETQSFKPFLWILLQPHKLFSFSKYSLETANNNVFQPNTIHYSWIHCVIYLSRDNIIETLWFSSCMIHCIIFFCFCFIVHGYLLTCTFTLSCSDLAWIADPDWYNTASFFFPFPFVPLHSSHHCPALVRAVGVPLCGLMDAQGTSRRPSPSSAILAGPLRPVWLPTTWPASLGSVCGG